MGILSFLPVVCALAAYFIASPTTVEVLEHDFQAPFPELSGVFAPNDLLLKNTVKWADGNVANAETVAFDSRGRSYTFMDNGSIVEILKDGTSVEYAFVGGRPISGAFDANDNLYVADATRGLFRISRETREVVLVAARSADGENIGFADDVVIASDGKVYLSDATRISPWKNLVSGQWDLLNASILSFLQGPTGRVLVFDPVTSQTTVLASGLYFANGLALSPDESFLVVAETLNARLLRLWLRGDKRGMIETLTDLPVAPDGVSTGTDGFWLTSPSKRDPGAMVMADKAWLRAVVMKLPEFMRPKLVNYGLVMQVGFDGEWKRSMHDPTGALIHHTTSVTEHDGKLYIGTLGDLTFVGVYDLHKQ